MVKDLQDLLMDWRWLDLKYKNMSAELELINEFREIRKKQYREREKAEKK